MSRVDNKNPQGFTLVEILVAIGIFAILSVMLTAIFININQLQQRTANIQRVQNEARYITEKLAKEIRGRELVLNYSAAGGTLLTPVTEINFLADEYNQQVSIRWDETDHSLYYQTTDLTSGVSGESSLNADDIELTKALFYVLPTTDPFSRLPASNDQPRVLMQLTLQNRPGSSPQTAVVNLQTTISSKVYQR